MADLSFDEVTRELGISSGELKRMIADNEIRAFHAGGQLRFKREDVSKLKHRLETAPTIILSDTDADSILEEPVLEEPVTGEPALAGEDALARDDTVLSVEGLLEDDSTSLEEPALAAEGGLEQEDTLPPVAAGVGEDTVLDSGLLEEEDLSLAGVEEAEEGGLLEEGVRAAPRRVRARSMESSPAMTAVLVVTGILLILPGAVLVNLSGGDNGVFPPWIGENLTFLNGVIDGIVSLF